MNSQRAIEVIERLQKSGHIAYLAGGSVRDMLLGIPSDDYDVATSASVEEIIALFPKTLTVGAHFGVVIVMVKGQKIEVATFRRDGPYSNGRQPDSVERGSPAEDAKRRDFTINGLFYDPLKECIYDFVGGQKDLEDKILRAIGNPHERFAEDRLRMLRAVRFALRFHLTIDQATYQAIQENSHLLFPAVSVERVWQELEKMSDKPAAFALLYALGLLPAIFPNKKLDINNLHKIARLPSKTPLIIFLALLFPTDPFEPLAAFFKCSHASYDHLARLTEARTMSKESSFYEWAHYFAKDPGLFYLQIWARFEQKESLSEEEALYDLLYEDICRIQEKKPLIDAAILQQKGIKPGPLLGKLLKKAEELSINERLSSQEEVLKRLSTLSLWLAEE